MAKEIEEVKTTSNTNETGPGSNNNLYQKGFEKTQSYDEKSDGMGIERPATLKPFEAVPGSLADERESLLNREVNRFNELRSKAFGRNIQITNAGIALDSFGGAFSEQGSPVNRGKGEDTQGAQEY
jgi:hypothetical protein